jgi:beta-galactosidase
MLYKKNHREQLDLKLFQNPTSEYRGTPFWAWNCKLDQQELDRQLEILKEMGCNSIRMTHNPPAPEVLDLCDKHGILVIDELFDIWKRQKYEKVNGYHILWDEWWQKDVRNFMLRDRNHPSIIAWSGGNEIMEQTMSKTNKAWNELNFRIGYGLRDEIRKYDTTRPYTVGCNDQDAWRNGFIDTMDLYGFNYKPHLYAKFRQTHPTSRTMAQKPAPA